MTRRAEELRALQDADAAGFLVFNLFDLWQNRDKSALRIAEWDDHPNAAGNRLIADRLFELMQQHRSELRLGTAAPQLMPVPRGAAEQVELIVTSTLSASRKGQNCIIQVVGVVTTMRKAIIEAAKLYASCREIWQVISQRSDTRR